MMRGGGLFLRVYELLVRPNLRIILVSLLILSKPGLGDPSGDVAPSHGTCSATSYSSSSSSSSSTLPRSNESYSYMGLAGRALVSISLIDLCLRMGFFARRGSLRPWPERSRALVSEGGAATVSGTGSGLGGGAQSTAVCKGP
ncbi:hypothetical protein BD410DRAFT_532901 [Rickenella mellea]|uniref:Uncharacterized protein n=1 Tax=Rickenella mellea TaxID=50990 RepID=A0A4Y7QHC0_9AGAM|nr:hypothetical protein BD410DRAFT_532901 [Rickenella mellea]